MKKYSNYRKQNGFSILDVVIGILIFTVGMLALAALQGALTRSMADSKLRTTAVKLADRAIERQRGFTQVLSTDPPGAPFAYNDIVTPGTDLTILRNGVTYTIDMNVVDYYYQLASDTFTTANTLGVSSSDYKQVDVTVSWDAVQDFRGGEGAEIDSGDLNTGSVTLTSTIPAVITSASGRVSDESDGGDLNHEVTYTPGLNPDVVALDLEGGKFKESLLPEPDVMRTDELVQTTFDVITYSTNGDGTQFLRREEFAAVSCECTLRARDGNLARRPVIWAGDEYMAGHWVAKDYGESANNKNSSLCDSCCRDHHDGGLGSTEDSSDPYANVFGPFKTDAEYPVPGQARGTSDHAHYQPDGTIANDGDEYLEACRLVRIDGFFKVAQDFRREDQYVFPDDFLRSAADITTYSAYVTTAAAAYKDDVVLSTVYPTSSPPCIGIPEDPDDGSPIPTCVAAPTMQGSYPTSLVTGQLPSWTTLQTGVTDEQQLRSRGIYIDYLSYDLRLFMSQCFDGDGDLVSDCCIRNGAVASNCSADDLYLDKAAGANLLEIFPFYEVQLTKLENWDQTARVPLTIALANEAIEDANAHDRGIAAQWNPKPNDPIVLGGTVVKAGSHRGNIGFTNTLAIDPEFDNLEKEADLELQSLDASGNGSVTGGDPVIRIEGNFSEDVAGTPALAVEGIGDVFCGLKPNGYFCNVATTATTPMVKVYGYEDSLDPLDPDDVLEAPRYACSDTLLHEMGSPSTLTGDTNATFSLYDGSGLLVAGTTYDITIQLTSSPCM